eukprot:CAMPEP_0195138428 /NCGR_PEP_ID=MMETSP0448-20130528/157628_1 /TAXON_ID=66468 /ORGANISM="Heterocapsa triquestra, Strain CCMP 448" /LENGTH=51 /DNA_ID=CAMNT_0040176697 /DNA_START=48 /DNA_END=200 /DNA_ORIENTATION=+
MDTESPGLPGAGALAAAGAGPRRLLASCTFPNGFAGGDLRPEEEEERRLED